MSGPFVAWAAAAFIIIGFALLLARLGLVAVARVAAGTARQSLTVLRDPNLSDDTKEAALQASSKLLFAAFARLTAGLALALALPMALVWLLGRAGWLDFDAVIAVSLTWPFLLGGVILFFVVLLMPGRR